MAAQETIGSDKLYHNLAIVVLVACPLIAALPPRRLNLGTAGLGLSWVLAGNHLLRERQNRIALSHHASGLGAQMGAGTKPEVERGLNAEARAADERNEGKQPLIQLPADTEANRTIKSQRAEEYQRKLDEGAGYGDIIKEQVWEVWNQNKGSKD